MSTCFCVPSVGEGNQESWRLLVEECIENIAKLRILFFWKILIILLVNFFQGVCGLFLCEPAPSYILALVDVFLIFLFLKNRKLKIYFLNIVIKIAMVVWQCI